MTEQELLARIEAQAVEIARLKKENEDHKYMVNSMPERIRRNLLAQMARGAVNCGQHSGCWLASCYLEQDEKNKKDKATV